MLLLLLFSHSVVSNSLLPHGLWHASLHYPAQSPGVCSNSCPLSPRCHPTISSSVVLFSYCLQSLPASGSFLISQLFTSGRQSFGAYVTDHFNAHLSFFFFANTYYFLFFKKYYFYLFIYLFIYLTLLGLSCSM